MIVGDFRTGFLFWEDLKHLWSARDPIYPDIRWIIRESLMRSSNKKYEVVLVRNAKQIIWCGDGENVEILAWIAVKNCFEIIIKKTFVEPQKETDIAHIIKLDGFLADMTLMYGCKGFNQNEMMFG